MQTFEEILFSDQSIQLEQPIHIYSEFQSSHQRHYYINNDLDQDEFDQSNVLRHFNELFKINQTENVLLERDLENHCQSNLTDKEIKNLALWQSQER